MNHLDITKLYGKHIEPIHHTKESSVYAFQACDYPEHATKETTGSGTVYNYELYDGISLFVMDFFVDQIDYSNTNQTYPNDFICINHCEKGRFEAEFSNGQCVYLGETDISMNLPENSPANHSFPMNRFLGSILIIDTPKAIQSMKELTNYYGTIPIDILALKERLQRGNEFSVYRNNQQLSALFTHFYEEHPNLFLMKIKVLELLYYITNYNEKQAVTYRYFNKLQVQKVKSIEQLLTTNIEKRYTLTDLSKEYEISLTSLKECFKEVYGNSISAYVREYRMMYAAKLLRSTDLTVGEISDQIGYENQSKFAEMFKQTIGMPPIEYRNKKFD